MVQAWRWQVAASSDVVPLTWAARIGDAVLHALADTSWTIRGGRRLPVCLHGPDDPQQRGWNHGHAFILPEDADADGEIDHLTVAAKMGLDPNALRLLVATDRLALPNGVAIELVPERMGGLDLAGHHGPAQAWVSRTAYVPPNGRPDFDAKDAAKQLRNEIGRRGLTAPLARPPLPVPHLDHGGYRFEPEMFHLVAVNGDKPPRGSQPCFFRLEFERAVTGPLAFGWACHRGLGQFVPAAE